MSKMVSIFYNSELGSFQQASKPFINIKFRGGSFRKG
jgi:hypothetical protein